MVNKNFIEINGRKYDATTGRLITPASAQTPNLPNSKTSHAPLNHSISGPKVVDGFMKPKGLHANALQHNKQTVKPHSPAKSKTLVRKSVKKPSTMTQVATHKTPLSLGQNDETPEGPMLGKEAETRKQRAESTAQNSLISRFGFLSRNNLSNDEKPMSAIGGTTMNSHNAISKTPNVVKKDVLINDAIQKSEHHQKITHRKIQPLRHKVARKVGVSNRVVNVASVSLILILIVAFIGYQNVPNINMRIASTKAGFNASIPGYKPSGFSMSKNIEASPGQVVINFRSNSDDRNFKIIEKTSNWNSEVLLEKYITQNDKTYQTYQDKGKTIYIYDGSNATWVDTGVWYRVEGKSSLNNTQLLDIVSSI